MTHNIDTILLDLDDTLLGNPMEQFLPRYFALLQEYARPLVPDGKLFQAALMGGTRAMIANTDPARTNHAAFWRTFVEQTGLDAVEAEAFFAGFYRDVFPKLQAYTEQRPQAAELVRYCFARGLKVVIATNPLFPRPAVEQRLAWAGIPVDEYPYALVTAYEEMHAAKPQPAYFQEILQRVEATADRALMVGDSWENDIVPAGQIGMAAYWITRPENTPPDPALVAAWGTLDDLFNYLRQNEL